MSWDDYCDYWDRVGIADRTRDIHSVHFQYNHAHRWLGPLVGMFKGCYDYWCCCIGWRRLYCPKRSQEENVAFDGKGQTVVCGCSQAKVLDRI